jgi:hypothetical protein
VVSRNLGTLSVIHNVIFEKFAGSGWNSKRSASDAVVGSMNRNHGNQTPHSNVLSVFYGHDSIVFYFFVKEEYSRDILLVYYFRTED